MPNPSDPTANRTMEFVFVVPREKLFPDAYPHGFMPFRGAEGPLEGKAHPGGSDLAEAMNRRIEEFGFFVERERAEQSPEWKQIIPYTLVVRAGQVLCLARTKKGGEKRLHNKLSLGVGGHINPVDLPLEAKPDGRGSKNPIHRATIREVLEEELNVEGTHQLRALGLLNDDTNPVGAVHLGWVQTLSVQGDVSVRETDQLEGSFKDVAELKSMAASGANFETWSSFLIPELDRLIETPLLRAEHPHKTPANSQ